MQDIRIVVSFEGEIDGFTAGRGYHVIMVQDRRILVVNDEARLVWLDSSLPIVSSIDRGSDRLFDLETHRFRRRLEALVGRRVRFSTWEHIGFDPDEVTAENMNVYRGTVEAYDGETLFLRRGDADEGRFGVLPQAIATLDEEA